MAHEVTRQRSQGHGADHLAAAPLIAPAAALAGLEAATAMRRRSPTLRHRARPCLPAAAVGVALRAAACSASRSLVEAGQTVGSTGPAPAHLRRPSHHARFPLHVTLRMLPHVWNLRSRRSFRVFARAVSAAADRFGMRVCAFSVQGNHRGTRSLGPDADA